MKAVGTWFAVLRDWAWVWAMVLGLASSGAAATSGAQPVRIACVGDSLTFGYGTTPATVYPMQLGGFLGSGYTVGNFGQGGTSVLNQGMPYLLSAPATASRSFAPDVVVIMLGTNDAHNDLTAYYGVFPSDYANIIATYRGLAHLPRVVCCIPPPTLSGNADLLYDNLLVNDIDPMIVQTCATCGVPVIDVRSPLINDPGDYVDGVHLDAHGYGIVATTIFNGLITAGIIPDQVAIAGVTGATNAETMVFTASFTCPVTAIDVDQLQVSGAIHPSAAPGVNGTWLITVDPRVDGPVALTIPPGSVQRSDGASNPLGFTVTSTYTGTVVGTGGTVTGGTVGTGGTVTGGTGGTSTGGTVGTGGTVTGGTVGTGGTVTGGTVGTGGTVTGGTVGTGGTVTGGTVGTGGTVTGGTVGTVSVGVVTGGTVGSVGGAAVSAPLSAASQAGSGNGNSCGLGAGLVGMLSGFAISRLRRRWGRRH